MLKLLTYELSVVPREARLLRETLDRYNKACTYIADYADRREVYALEKLRKHAERNVLLKKKVETRFGIHTGIVEGAMRRVVDDYKRLNPQTRGSARREDIPTYDWNNWMLCTASTASIVMETILPTHTSAYPFRVSVSTYKNKKGRLRLPLLKPSYYDAAPSPDDDPWAWKKNEVRLGVNPDRELQWQLLVGVDVPADDENKEADVADDALGDDPTLNPDYQEPDYTPPEDVMD